MKVLRFVLLLALASTIHAQSVPFAPVQSVVCGYTTTGYNPQASYTCKLAPTVRGDLLIMHGYMGDFTPYISDSQGNLWLQANFDTNNFFYTPANNGGVETITFTYPAAEYLDVQVVEFPGTWVLSDVIRPRYRPIYGGESINYQDDTNNPMSKVLTTTNPNELVIGYGDEGPLYPTPPNITAAPGWSLIKGMPFRWLQYTVLVTPGTITSSVTQDIFLPENTYVVLGVVGFKQITSGVIQ